MLHNLLVPVLALDIAADPEIIDGGGIGLTGVLIAVAVVALAVVLIVRAVNKRKK